MSTLSNEIKSYLERHKILEIFAHLSEMIFFFKPDNPVDFMAETIWDMMRAIKSGSTVPSMYTEESFKAYFRLMDPVGVGMITWNQLRSAFAVLGFRDVKLPALREIPVHEDIFVDMGMKCVAERLNVKKSYQ